MAWDNKCGLRRVAVWKRERRRKIAAERHEARREELQRHYEMGAPWETPDYYDDHSAFKSIQRRMQ
jgi:hypothetical protein